MTNVQKPVRFVTHFGSYTLVLKPDGTKPIYDHKGIPKVVEGTIYAEFKNVPGTAIGTLETNDERTIKALRENKNYGKTFKEIEEQEFKVVANTQARPTIRLSKSVLSACNKNELTSMATQYTVKIDDSMSKSDLIELIMKAQDATPAAPSAPEITPVVGGIDRIVQKCQTC